MERKTLVNEEGLKDGFYLTEVTDGEIIIKKDTHSEEEDDIYNKIKEIVGIDDIDGWHEWQKYGCVEVEDGLVVDAFQW